MFFAFSLPFKPSICYVAMLFVTNSERPFLDSPFYSRWDTTVIVAMDAMFDA